MSQPFYLWAHVDDREAASMQMSEFEYAFSTAVSENQSARRTNSFHCCHIPPLPWYYPTKISQMSSEKLTSDWEK